MDSFFTWAADQIAGVVQWVWDHLTEILYGIIQEVGQLAFAALSWLWGVVQGIFSWLGSVFRAVLDFLENTLHWLFHNLLPDLLHWLNDLRAKIRAWLDPLIQWIKYERALLDNFYNTVLRPILNLLQRLRSILIVFRLLHLKWAAALDQWLADLEAQLATRFLEVRGDLQTLANWINYIIDPTGIFNLPLLLLSAIQTLPQLFGALWGIQSSPIGAQDAAAQQASAQSGLHSNAVSAVQLNVNGPTADDLTRHTALVALYQQDGYTVV